MKFRVCLFSLSLFALSVHLSLSLRPPPLALRPLSSPTPLSLSPPIPSPASALSVHKVLHYDYPKGRLSTHTGEARGSTAAEVPLLAPAAQVLPETDLDRFLSPRLSPLTAFTPWPIVCDKLRLKPDSTLGQRLRRQ